MRFKPSIKLTLLMFVLAFIFVRLGLWQTDRRTEKMQLFEQFDNAPVMSLEAALLEQVQFARVSASGRYDPKRHILLDNRIYKGRAGVHVLTPFELESGKYILVNRGWLPLAADRRSLPEFSTEDGQGTIRGILNRPSEGGQRLGDADIVKPDPWPQLVTYLDIATVGEALDVPLEPWLLQLDAAEQSGFEDRQWQAAVMAPKVHGAYAVQWFALAAAALVIWIILGIRRAKNPAA
jgi:surfeit locus 1 family protein